MELVTLFPIQTFNWMKVIFFLFENKMWSGFNISDEDFTSVTDGNVLFD